MRLMPFLFFLMAGSCLLGQIPDFSSRTSGGSQSDSREQSEYVESPDTFGVFQFYADNPNLEIPFSDSSLIGYFHQYDPARAQDLDYLHLGVVGSAAIPVLYQSPNRKGFDIGLHQFDHYFTRSIDLPFHRLEKPYTNLAYAQLGDQSDTYFTGQFSRNFANGLNFSLDYKRASLVGQQNQFPNQNSRNTAIAMGLWIHGENGRYDGFLTFAANTAEQENNGGISVEPSSTGDFLTLSSAQTFLDNAQTRHSLRDFTYTHYLKFGGFQDSTGRQSRSYTVGHQINYISSNFKSFDTFSSGPTASDSSYYNNFLVDFRGLRFALEHRRLENTFQLNTFRLKKNSGNVPQGQKDLIEVALSHSINWLDFERSDSTINNLFLSGRIGFNPSERLKINTYGHLGLLDNLGDFKLEGELFLDFKKLGQLSAKATNQFYEANLMQSRFEVSQKQIWKNNFQKTLETSLSGTYAIPSFKFSVTGNYFLVNNMIYFDETGFPIQTGTPVNILQLLVQKDFQVGHFHLDNIVSLQTISEDFIQLPSFYTKNSLYYVGKWFNVLNVRLGADLRFNDSFNAYYYNPLTGQFQVQNAFLTESFPVVDGFFSMRVTKFRAFVKWENILNSIDPSRFYYQLAYYPHWQGGLRFGIKWRFVN